MYTTMEMCEMLKLTEDQLRRRCRADGITPIRRKGVNTYTDEDLALLKMGVARHMSAEGLARYLGVQKETLVLSNDYIEINGVKLYNVTDTQRRTPIQKKEGITTETMMQILHKPYYRILKAIPDNMKNVRGQYDEEVFEAVKKYFDTYATVTDIAEELPISGLKLKSILDQKGIQPAFSGKVNEYKRDEVEAAIDGVMYTDTDQKKRFSTHAYKLVDNPQQALELALIGMRETYTHIPQTIDIGERFIRGDIDKLKNKDPLRRTKNIIADMIHIFDALTKELTEYRTDELKELVETLQTEMSKLRLARLTSYILGSGYETEFTYPITYIVQKQGKALNAYPKDEWARIVKRLLDMEQHVDNALADPLYAEVWLLELSHAFLAWRLSDFRKLPVPKCMKYAPFLTIADAEMVTSEIAEATTTLHADKVEADPLVFIHPPAAYMMAWVVAVLICKKHHSKYLISDEATKNYQREKFHKISGCKFSSRQANKTLLTHQYDIALTTPGYIAVAYKYSSLRRGHMTDVHGLTNVTSVYISAMPNEIGGALTDDIIRELVARGTFGYLYDELLEILTRGNADLLSFSEKTQIIKSLQTAYTPWDAEDISGYLLNSIDMKKSIIQEWQGRIPELKKMLHDAIHSNNSKEDLVICACLSGCPYPTTVKCLKCKYSLMPMYMAAQLGGTIRENLIELNKTSSTGINNINYRRKLKTDIIQQLELAACLKTTFKNNANVMDLLRLEDIYGDKSTSDEDHLLR